MANMELAQSIAAHAAGCTYRMCQENGTVGSSACQNRIRTKVSDTIGITRAENISSTDTLKAAVQFARIQCRCEANKGEVIKIRNLSQAIIKRLNH